MEISPMEDHLVALYYSSLLRYGYERRCCIIRSLASRRLQFGYLLLLSCRGKNINNSGWISTNSSSKRVDQAQEEATPPTSDPRTKLIVRSPWNNTEGKGGY